MFRYEKFINLQKTFLNFFTSPLQHHAQHFGAPLGTALAVQGLPLFVVLDSGLIRIEHPSVLVPLLISQLIVFFSLLVLLCVVSKEELHDLSRRRKGLQWRRPVKPLEPMVHDASDLTVVL